MANRAKYGWTRRERVVNPADPTQLIIWKLNLGWFRVTLSASWGVASGVSIGRWRYEGYDQWWAVRLFEMLEDGLVTEEYDPEIVEAERRAGWDPNP